MVTLIEDELLHGPWVMGDVYTICDPYLFTISRRLEDDGVDTDQLPRILEHRRCMVNRSATQAGLSQVMTFNAAIIHVRAASRIGLTLIG